MHEDVDPTPNIRKEKDNRVDVKDEKQTPRLDKTREEPRVHLQGSGDENPTKFGTRRTALRILEEYAKRCKMPITYEYATDGPQRYKSTGCVIRGNLGGFAATCRGDTESSTKNSLALKILRMIAARQMDDEKLALPLNLTREEMLEVLGHDTAELRETAQRKLYRICLEKGEPVPGYCSNTEKTYQGFTYSATCTALGYVGKGRGVRECVAKRAAADELYGQYCRDNARFCDLLPAQGSANAAEKC
ncbi:hypothetical protein KM043_009067 [Ampulex compressa]|nr:hypothetical protein KM043_009067 [Ampulex compressa]